LRNALRRRRALAIADVRPGAETVKMIEAGRRRRWLAMRCDVANLRRAMAAGSAEKFSRCDILINCAGIYPQLAFDE